MESIHERAINIILPGVFFKRVLQSTYLKRIVCWTKPFQDICPTLFANLDNFKQGKRRQCPESLWTILISQPTTPCRVESWVRGVWGHAPPENFWKLDALRSDFQASRVKVLTIIFAHILKGIYFAQKRTFLDFFAPPTTPSSYGPG